MLERSHPLLPYKILPIWACCLSKNFCLQCSYGPVLHHVITSYCNYDSNIITSGTLVTIRGMNSFFSVISKGLIVTKVFSSISWSFLVNLPPFDENSLLFFIFCCNRCRMRDWIAACTLLSLSLADTVTLKHQIQGLSHRNHEGRKWYLDHCTSLHATLFHVFKQILSGRNF